MTFLIKTGFSSFIATLCYNYTLYTSTPSLKKYVDIVKLWKLAAMKWADVS